MKASRWVAFTAAMSGLTVVLSILTVPFMLGVRIHFFQFGVMLAAVVGGPISGLVTGTLGGVYMALMRGDPTIIVGNGMLGLFTALFARRLRPALAAVSAWAFVQAPWISLTGVLLLRIPYQVLALVLVVLTVENIISAIIVEVMVKRFRLSEIVNPRRPVQAR